MTETAFIILAGGSGSRFRAAKPKQLAMLAGKMILQHTLENVASCTSVEHIVLVAQEDTIDIAQKIVAEIDHSSIKVVKGGSNRLLSTKAGLDAIDAPPDTKVLLHDGVRPFIQHDVIRACYSALDSFEAVDVVIPSADTLVRVKKSSDVIRNIPPRKNFRRGQTPQGFWLGKIRAVMDQIRDLATSEFTDDCGMYLSVHPKTQIGLVPGDESNIKITHPIDLFMAEQLIMSGQTSTHAALANTDLSTFHVVIFGASSGLGENAISHLQELGVSVYGASRQTGCDITRPDDVAAALAQAARSGPIDAVLNFAGTLHVGKLVESDPAVLENLVRTNYLGAMNVARIAYPYLKAAAGQLILVSSSSYYRGRPNTAAYSSSKAAVVNLVQALAEEWSDDQIQVNCIVPRRADTPMRHAAFPDEDRTTLLPPQDVSTEVVNLLMSDSSGVISHVY